MKNLRNRIEESLLDADLDTKRDIDINMAIVDKFKKTCIGSKREPLEIGDVVLCDYVGIPAIGVVGGGKSIPDIYDIPINTHNMIMDDAIAIRLLKLNNIVSWSASLWINQ